jgi:hypothetical protein
LLSIGDEPPRCIGALRPPDFCSTSGIPLSPFTLHKSVRPCEYFSPTAITEVQILANPEHLKILKQGLIAWKKWRGKNSGITPDLSSANLGGRDLSQANLCGAGLVGANLFGARLRGANISVANFTEAYLRGADLRGAYIEGADLRWADLSNSDFANALVGLTVFGDNDLSTVKELETVGHYGPSTIGIDTIYKSKGNIPEAFL